jgi:hypothetical protein
VVAHGPFEEVLRATTGPVLNLGELDAGAPTSVLQPTQ